MWSSSKTKPKIKPIGRPISKNLRKEITDGKEWKEEETGWSGLVK